MNTVIYVVCPRGAYSHVACHSETNRIWIKFKYFDGSPINAVRRKITFDRYRHLHYTISQKIFRYRLRLKSDGTRAETNFVFRRNGRVHLKRRGRQFSRLLAAEVCASALVMLGTPRSEVLWVYLLPTPFANFPFTSPTLRHRVPSGFKRTLQTRQTIYV